jgi:predicted nucleotidyltransferase
MVNTEITGIIRKYLHLLAQNGIPVQRAFVYGSYARNEERKDSDIDVMLVSDYFDTTDIYKTSKPWRFAADVDHRIEPVSVSEERFINDDASPLIAVVKQEGIEIKMS